MQLLTGIFLGSLAGYLAWRVRALTPSGAWAAALTGSAVYGLGGPGWAILLLAFFISSSALSRLFGRRKADLIEKYSKGSQRDAAQVLANGGLAALLAALSAVSPGMQVWWLAFGGALAAVNADTWATELGVLSPAAPRLVTTGQRVVRGASGGVTLLGYLAALGGSALIAGLAAWAGPLSPSLAQVISITLAGVTGATFDSFLGATVQAIYHCPACQKETERHPLHTCGGETFLLRGWPWLDNDWVNLLASVVGAAAAVVLGVALLG